MKKKGFFRNTLRKFFNLGLSDPKAWNPSLWNLVGSKSLSGEVVTEETALTYSAFWNAVNLISGTISTLPLHLFQKSGRKTQIADDSPVYAVMHDRWNQFMTAKTGRQTITAHALTWGNGYAEKVLNGVGEVIALWPIPPNRVLAIEVIGSDLFYKLRIGNETKYLPRAQVLHLHGLGFDGFVGYSVVLMARKSLGLSMAMETFGSNFFGQGTHPGVIVSHPSSLGIEGHANLKQSLTEAYSGLGQTHRLMLLEDGMKIEKVGIPPEDSQFLESRQFQVPEIARWFNLPPHKLKDLTKSSFNNIEQEQISFVTDSILPWLIDFEQEYNLQLLTEAQRLRSKLYFKHIVEGLLRADAKSRAEFYQIMKRNGLMTPNEIRGKEDLNPSNDPSADELWTEINVVPISKLDNYLGKTGGDKSKSQLSNADGVVDLSKERSKQEKKNAMV